MKISLPSGSLLIGSLLIASLLVGQHCLAAEPRVVGYFAEWAVYQRNFQVKDIPADKLTHINYAFAKIVNGECAIADTFAAVEKAYPGDTSEGGNLHGSFNQLLLLKKKHPHLKTLVSVGGWSLSDAFSDAATSEASRGKFARSCVAFIKKYGFDGVDIDWEYPGGNGSKGSKSRKEDTGNFTRMLAELRRQLDAAGTADGKHYLLTIAAPAGPGLIARLEVAKLQKSLDWINVMTYDFHGGWDKKTNFNAPLYAVPNEPGGSRKFNSDATIKGYLAAGAPADKVVLGVPFYGRSWKGVNSTNDGLFQPASGKAGSFDYRSIAAKYLGSFAHHWQDDAKVPWLYDAKSHMMISYDDPQSIKLKAAYARDNHLGGVMIWELSQDDAKGSLISAVKEGLSTSGPSRGLSR